MATETEALANIAAGLSSPTGGTEVEPELKVPNPYQETIEDLATRVEADPTLWDRLSDGQRIALGYHQRAALRTPQEPPVVGNTDDSAATQEG